MVADAHAVVEPWAVMVEALDAAITDGAVARARGAQDETVGAHLARMDLREHLEEVMLRAQLARVFRRGDKEAQSDEGSQRGNNEGKRSEGVF